MYRTYSHPTDNIPNFMNKPLNEFLFFFVIFHHGACSYVQICIAYYSCVSDWVTSWEQWLPVTSNPVRLDGSIVWDGLGSLYVTRWGKRFYIFELDSQFFSSNAPPHVLVDFVVLPPGHGRNVTDFWVWDAHEARSRCPDDVSGDIGGCSARRALKPKFY